MISACNIRDCRNYDTQISLGKHTRYSLLSDILMCTVNCLQNTAMLPKVQAVVTLECIPSCSENLHLDVKF